LRSKGSMMECVWNTTNLKRSLEPLTMNLESPTSLQNRPVTQTHHPHPETKGTTHPSRRQAPVPEFRSSRSQSTSSCTQNQGCLKCRRLFVDHCMANCPNEFPNPKKYQMITQAIVDAVKTRLPRSVGAITQDAARTPQCNRTSRCTQSPRSCHRRTTLHRTCPPMLRRSSMLGTLIPRTL
jgi:hypothetical protein